MAQADPFKEECRTCDGNGRWMNYDQAGRYRAMTCPTCKGSQLQAKLCQHCDEVPAVSVIDGEALCAECGEFDDLAALVAGTVRVAPDKGGSIWL